MKNKLVEQLQGYIIPVGSIAVVIAMVPLFLMPQLNRIADASKVINKNQNRLDTIEKKASDLDKLAQNRDSLNKKLKIVEQALPVDKAVAPLVSGIQQLAISSGLTVKSLKIQPGKVATGSAKPVAAQAAAASPIALVPSGSSVVFQINLGGDTAGFRRFLTTLESAKRILVLQSFKSSSTDGVGYSFEVFLQAPYSTLPKISSDQVGEALPTLTVANENLISDLDSSQFHDVTQTQFPTGPTGVKDPFQ